MLPSSLIPEIIARVTSHSRLPGAMSGSGCSNMEWRGEDQHIITWRPVVQQVGAPFALSSCITIGLIAIGLIGYSNMMARDRERGVFQRLRLTPATTWDIMFSRLMVQSV